jgi:Kef-type K+ transport system membrane component KefB
MSEALLTLAMSGVFIAFMALVGRPAVRWFVKKHEESKEGLTQKTLAFVLGGVLLCAITTEAIGIHALFGAFVFGALIPTESKLAKDIERQVANLVVVLFLPAFFAFTGMRTEIGLISTPGEWLFCGVIIAVAVIGKFGGSFAAASASGIGWRDSARIGALMNTRGLMELIVLNLGLDLKVISPTIFAMMVIMALVTTFMTTPILHLLRRGQTAEEETIDVGDVALVPTGASVASVALRPLSPDETAS